MQNQRAHGNTYSRAIVPSPHDNHKPAEIRSAVRERIACIIDNSGICAQGKDGKRGSNGKGENIEVSNGIMRNAVYRRVMQRDLRIVERRDRTGIDAICWDGSEECALGTIVT